MPAGVPGGGGGAHHVEAWDQTAELFPRLACRVVAAKGPSCDELHQVPTVPRDLEGWGGF